MEPAAKKPRVDTTAVDDSKEKEYGIDEIMHRGIRFSGIVKQRHCDFIVRECNIDGEVVRLTDIERIDDTGNSPKIDTCPLPNDMLKKIEEFADTVDASSASTEAFKFPVVTSRDERKKIHEYIRVKFHRLESDTEFVEGQHYMKLSLKKDADKPTRRNRPNKYLPKFLHFVLYKQGKGTMDCISKIANILHTSVQNFSYAGTKDRRAASTQTVSLKFGSSVSLVRVNRDLNTMAVGNFSYKKAHIKLGELSGNQFVVVIRNISETNDVVETACESLKNKGFWNYFGLQRFGTGGVPNYLVGAMLLQGEFEKAVELILTPLVDRDSTDTENQAKLQWKETHNSTHALKSIKHVSSNEGIILTELSKSSTDFLGAFQKIPKNGRLLYVHAFQSYIFNKVISIRIREHGNAVCVGDFVLVTRNGKESVRPLSQNEVESNKYTIYDIVLPMPGFQMIYPDYMRPIYETLMKEHALNLYDMERKQKILSLPGSYRKIAVLPKDVSWKFHRYDDYKIPLVKTDMELVKEKREITKSSNEVESQAASPNESESNEDGAKDEICKNEEKPDEGKHKALELSMTLPKSAYATMALREILIEEVSFDAQMKLNKEFLELDNDDGCDDEPPKCH